MKKTIFILMIIASFIYSQGWNNIVTTTINETNIERLEQYSNKDGVHLVIQKSGSSNSVKYYLLNSSGAVVRSSTIQTGSGASFVNISGDNNVIYIVYKLGSNLKATKSTDAGANWYTQISDKQIGSNTCNGVDVVYNSNDGLHVVYAMQDNGSNYETYYYLLNSYNNWTNYKQVTDVENEVGGFPSVTVSSERVHVSYNTSTYSSPYAAYGTAKTRDKHNDSWQTPQTVLGNPDGSSSEFLAVRDTKLYDFYLKFWSGMGMWGNSLCVKDRTLSGSSWSSELQLNGSVDYSTLGRTTTNDNKLQIIYAIYNSLIHRSFDGSNWSSESTVTSSVPNYYCRGFGSVSNDLYVTWFVSGETYVKYRQYDAVPLAPTNISVSASAQYHPVVSWALNNEPDVRVNSQGYLLERRLDVEGSGQWTAWTQIATINGSTSSYEDMGVSHASGAGNSKAQYRLRAKDVGGYTSAYSSVVEIHYGTGMEKANGGSVSEVKEYALLQNYPNPFNPTTTISWQSPIDGYTTLKVYDILGKEVAVLVNEVLAAGEHTVRFDAGELTSGIYFYKLQVGEFTSLNKMILSK